VVRIQGAEQLELDEAPEPELQAPGDAIVEVSKTAICGADLFPYHGHTLGFEAGTIPGHEWVGVVREVGDGVRGVRPGQRVVNASMISDGSCGHCRAGRPMQCENRALFGYSGVYERLDGGKLTTTTPCSSPTCSLPGSRRCAAAGWTSATSSPCSVAAPWA
jgi:threonine dehydrogenase-like Zn-dependent dehydrogenase